MLKELGFNERRCTFIPEELWERVWLDFYVMEGDFWGSATHHELEKYVGCTISEIHSSPGETYNLLRRRGYMP